MNFMRKGFLCLLVGLLGLFLIIFVLDFGLGTTVTNPTPVKNIIASSGVYERVMPDVLSQAQTIAADSGNVPLNDPLVRGVANQAFSPSFIEQMTNRAIDSIYRWLNGKDAQPDFRIDLSAQKSQFATLVGRAATAKARALPACTSLMDLSSYSAFSATCLPAGVSPAEVGNNAETSVQNGQGFLENPVISASTIKSSGSNSSIFSHKLKNAPKYFGWIKKSPFVLAGLTVLAGIGIYFLSRSRRAGLKIVAVCLIVAGVLLLILAWAVFFVVHSQVPKINFGNQPLLGDSVKSIITKLAQAVDKNYWWLGGLYVVLGAAGIAGLRYWHKPSYKTSKPSRREPEDLPAHQ